jgi:hypothetical protein
VVGLSAVSNSGVTFSNVTTSSNVAKGMCCCIFLKDDAECSWVVRLWKLLFVPRFVGTSNGGGLWMLFSGLATTVDTVVSLVSVNTSNNTANGGGDTGTGGGGMFVGVGAGVSSTIMNTRLSMTNITANGNAAGGACVIESLGTLHACVADASRHARTLAPLALVR